MYKRLFHYGVLKVKTSQLSTQQQQPILNFFLHRGCLVNVSMFPNLFNIWPFCNHKLRCVLLELNVTDRRKVAHNFEVE